MSETNDKSSSTTLRESKVDFTEAYRITRRTKTEKIVERIVDIPVPGSFGRLGVIEIDPSERRAFTNTRGNVEALARDMRALRRAKA